MTKEELIEKGNRIIDAKKFEISWETFVNSSLGLFDEMALGLDTLKMLYRGDSLSDIYKYISKDVKDVYAMATILDIVTTYSDRGLDFEDYVVAIYDRNGETEDGACAE